MKELTTYTSTGFKLIHHEDVIKCLKAGYARPVSLQLAPTSQCNLNCDFCSNVNRDNHESLEFTRVITLLYELKQLGLKTVEWTGGGDPTMWSSLEAGVDYAEMIGLEQGLITNGINLHRYSEPFFNRLMWVRISMNCLDYVGSINIPEMPHTTLGFSYVMNERTKPAILERIRNYAKEYDAKYVRIVPNCQTTTVQQIENNRIYSRMVEKLGPPFFYQPKVFEKPEHCWWCYLKPFVLHDGYVYPCSSVVLNDEAERSFHSKYRWCTIEELPSKYLSEMESFDPQNCSHCVFRQQNDIVEMLVNTNGMEDFI